MLSLSRPLANTVTGNPAKRTHSSFVARRRDACWLPCRRGLRRPFRL